MDNEVWKNIIGYEGLYQVSNMGRIRSLNRTMKHRYGGTSLLNGRILKQRKNDYGYFELTLSKEGKVKQYRSNRLVAEAFISNPENFKCVCHHDDNRENNTIDNLFWGTYKMNSEDMCRKKRSLKGEKHNLAKLNEKQIRVIKHCIKLGMRCTDIAKYFPVTGDMVGLIKRNQNWAHITI